MNRRLCSRAAAGIVLAVTTVALAGCGSRQNTLAPQSHPARDIASLFWWMMGGAWIGLALVVVLLLWSWRRKRRGWGSDTTGPKPGEKRSVIVVVALGIATPIVVLVALFIVSDIFVIKTTEAPAATATKRTIVVIGHQWWWEAHYPGTNAWTANEIHIPAHTPVNIVVKSADVIHSFWVPRLNRKIDMIPGHVNHVGLYADKVGVYRGECAEYCGLQHAHMAFLIFADPPAKFRRWLANEAKPAPAPTSAEAKKGEQVFLNGPCQSCHTIRGTDAIGQIGPDLTHVGSRTTLGADTIPNRPGYLGGWIEDNQHIKPGNEMPDVQLSGNQLTALIAYLEGLK